MDKETRKVYNKIRRDLKRALRRHFNQSENNRRVSLPNQITMAGIVYNQVSPGKYVALVKPVNEIRTIEIRFTLFCDEVKPPSPRAIAWEERWHKR